MQAIMAFSEQLTLIIEEVMLNEKPKAYTFLNLQYSSKTTLRALASYHRVPYGGNLWWGENIGKFCK